MEAVAAVAAVDHLLLGVPDLAPGVAWFEARAGVRAAAARDLDGLLRRARAANLEMEGPVDGSRARPDGEVVRWRVAIAVGEVAARLEGVLPFFIEWQTPLHPSLDSPPGCELLALELASPHPDLLRESLAGLGIEADVRAAEHNGLAARLSTPQGILQLG